MRKIFVVIFSVMLIPRVVFAHVGEHAPAEALEPGHSNTNAQRIILSEDEIAESESTGVIPKSWWYGFGAVMLIIVGIIPAVVFRDQFQTKKKHGHKKL